VKHSSTQENEFLAVLEDHKKLIFKVAGVYCREPEERRDLIQEIILQLWKAFPRYDPRYAYSTWIYRIALNVSISFYRKKSKRQATIIPAEASWLELAGDDEQRNELSGDIALLHQLIARLNPLNKALMILYLEGHKQEEIAHILGITASNVSTKLGRIRQQFRRQFNAHKS
jgi:RNA polymerase sigma-70 factor (ECF subfamily)